ncbi:IS3 family transposase, partial [Bifidobacterium longum]|nr:IS3 family transposase [Bifidobacterium longum]
QLLEEENAYLKARVAYLEKVDALLAWRSATGTER